MSFSTLCSRVTLSAVAAVAVVSVAPVGAAHASCLSFSGLGNGNGCTTTTFGDLAIGIGDGVTAIADGGFNTAIAIGGTDSGLVSGQGTTASVAGVLSSATALGIGAQATTNGILSSTLAAGNPVTSTLILQKVPARAYAGMTRTSFLNHAVALGDASFSCASACNPVFGNINMAVAVGNHTKAIASPTVKFAAALGPGAGAVNGINNDVGFQRVSRPNPATSATASSARHRN